MVSQYFITNYFYVFARSHLFLCLFLQAPYVLSNFSEIKNKWDVFQIIRTLNVDIFLKKKKSFQNDWRTCFHAAFIFIESNNKFFRSEKISPFFTRPWILN